MIHIAPGFQYAINIAYDSGDYSKIKNYVFTSGSIDVFKNLFDSVYADSSDKSHFLSDAYGKGKSHLALVLMSIVSKADGESARSVIQQLKNLEPELHERVSAFYESDKKLLPVVIQNRADETLAESFMRSLSSALSSANLESLVPSSSFSAAADMIQKWKTEYAETYNAFAERVGNPDEFSDALRRFDSAAYSKFVELYPLLTSGSTFVPGGSGDAVSFYKEVNQKLAAFGYSGIYVVFDEFSKYLEANIGKNLSADLKLLQDFAEAANRSRSQQLHLLLITHQTLLNYVDSLGKTQVDSWKAVGNRFTELHFNTSLYQYYELASKIIVYDKTRYKPFCEKQCAAFKKMLDEWAAARCYSDMKKETLRRIFAGTFPLHPASLFILPVLSEKVAQNERTIFTFLASDAQSHTLPDFLRSHNFEDEAELSFITPDYLYDYFSPLFEMQSYKSAVFQVNRRIKASIAKLALLKIPDETKTLCRKIIKTLGIIKIIDRQELLAADEETLLSIFSQEKSAALRALQSLSENSIVSRNDFSSLYDFTDSSEINIEEKIQREAANTKNNSTAEILRGILKNRVFYPVRYNDENAVTRFFKVECSEDKNLSDENYTKSIEETFADGIFYCVLGSDIKAKDKITQRGAVCIFLKNPKDYNAARIQKIAVKYNAVCALLNQNPDAATALTLESIKNDLQKALDSFLDMFLKCELKKADYYIDGNRAPSCDRLQLDVQLTKSLETRYPKFPVILNEMVNRTAISGQASRACVSLLTQIFTQKEYIPLFGFKNTSQEVSILKSVFAKNGVYKQIESTVIFDPLSSDAARANKKLHDVFVRIDDFVKSASGTAQKLSALYETLTKKTGLRKGLIPFLLGAVFVRYKEHLFFTDGTAEYPLSAELLVAACEENERFSLSLLDWNKETQNYIENFEKLFEKYRSNTAVFTNRLERLAAALQKWYESLPSFTKNSLDVTDKKILKKLSSLRLNIVNFLFTFVPRETENPGDLENAFLAFKAIVEKADSFILKKITELTEQLFALFNAHSQAEFVREINVWCLSLSDSVKNHVTQTHFLKMLSVFSEPVVFIEDFVRKLCVAESGLRIEDWNNSTFSTFLQDIKKFKENYEHLQQKTVSELKTEFGAKSKNEYALQFRAKDGNVVVRTFDFQGEDSPQNKLLRNELRNSIAEYQDSLSPEEKCGVLLKLIQEILES